MPIKDGDQFRESFTVSAKTYEGFISLFGDRNPLHTDEAFAKRYGFKDKVMHGNLLNGFISYFIGECLPIKQVIILSQEINYKNPVYLGDHLLFEAKVTGYFESVRSAELAYTFKNDEKVVAKGKLQIGILL